MSFAEFDIHKKYRVRKWFRWFSQPTSSSTNIAARRHSAMEQLYQSANEFWNANGSGILCALSA